MHVQICCFAHKTNCFLTLSLSPMLNLLFSSRDKKIGMQPLLYYARLLLQM